MCIFIYLQCTRSFIMMYSACCTIHPCNMYKSIVSHILTVMDPSPQAVLQHCPRPQTSLQLTPAPRFPSLAPHPAMGVATKPFSVSHDLSVLDISWERKQTLCGLLWLLSLGMMCSAGSALCVAWSRSSFLPFLSTDEQVSVVWTEHTGSSSCWSLDT